MNRRDLLRGLLCLPLAPLALPAAAPKIEFEPDQDGVRIHGSGLAALVDENAKPLTTTHLQAVMDAIEPPKYWHTFLRGREVWFLDDEHLKHLELHRQLMRELSGRCP